MYVIHAPIKKFGVLAPGTSPICNEVKFFANTAFCPLHYWAKIHKNHGYIDITPPQLIKLRKERDLKTIVLFATGGIGDSLWIMPIARALRSKHPTATIGVVVDSRNKDTWRHCPYVNGVIDNNTWNVYGLLQRADECYDFGGIATVYKDLMKLEPVEATFKVAELEKPKSNELMRPFLQLTVDEGKAAQKVLLDKGIDISKEKVVCMGIESSTSNRNWPYSFTARLSVLLCDLGYKVVWLGKTNDLQTEEIKKATEKSGIVNLSGGTHLRRAMAIISLSDLFIGPNSSLMVIATSLQVPTVGLFGAFDPHRIGKYYDKFFGMWGKVDCSPCNEHWTECRHGHPSPCMRSITSESVLEKAKLMLSKYPRSKEHVLPIE